MKIHFIIEFETDAAGVPKKMNVNRLHEVAPADEKIAAKMKKNLEQSDALVSALPAKRRGRPPKVKPVEPPVVPENAALAVEQPAAPITRPGSGPQFVAGFLKAVAEAPQPFTRKSIAITTGRDAVCITQSLNRLQKRGWIETRGRDLWFRTNKFGIEDEQA